MVTKNAAELVDTPRMRQVLSRLSEQLGLSPGAVIGLALQQFARNLRTAADRLSDAASQELALDETARAELTEILARLERVRREDPLFANAREAYVLAEAALNPADDVCEGTLIPQSEADTAVEPAGRPAASPPDEPAPASPPLQRLARLLAS